MQELHIDMGEMLYMRSLNDRYAIVSLATQGKNYIEISKSLNIPARTVGQIMGKYKTIEDINNDNPAFWDAEKYFNTENIRKSYAFLLGIYLGDGYISPMRRTFKLRISQDKKYPNIINEIKQSISSVLPNRNVNLIDYKTYIEIYCYYKFLPIMFPQHGGGKKHERPIKLSQWQQTIVDTYPDLFIKGLFYSDGSRYIQDLKYIHYSFSNKSKNIHSILQNALEKYNINYTMCQTHKGSVYTTNIRQTSSVSIMEQIVGPKS